MAELISYEDRAKKVMVDSGAKRNAGIEADRERFSKFI